MDKGSTIGMDRFGFDTFLGTPARIETIVALAALGYADRMVLSHDTTAYSLSVDAATRARALPDWHFRFIPDTIVPALLERGVSARDVDRMLIDNPRAFFSRSDAY
jgi:phosphotriesterase-related protein